MSRIVPIPTTRVGDLFVRQQLVGQLQFDQLSLFRLQNQVSTGQRIQLPSEDSTAALRAINLQRLLERKAQVRKNVETSTQYLGAAWSTLSDVPSELARVRAAALGAAGTVVTDSDRTTAIRTIDGVLAELVSVGNSRFQGRYLFAGSRSQVQPYDFNGQFVEYRGNEGLLRSYVDLERLFDTSVAGPDVFGGISTPVQGSADLNPHLTPDTLLSTVNGGNGISPNPAVTVSINLGLSTVSNVVDLSGAVTLGDVARLIELGAPTGTEVVAEVTGTGLKLTTPSGTIKVSEVAEGRTARELGIFTAPTAPASNTINGSDLNPRLLKTTPLANLLGSKAQGRVVSSGANNDIVITAAQNGTDLKDVTVEFVGGGVAGSEVVSYDTDTKTLTVQVAAGASTATQVATAITNHGLFTAAVDYRDAASTAQAGSNDVDVANFGVITDGGSGEDLDLASGLILSNGGQSVTLDTSTAETVGDLLNQIIGSDLGLHAEINAAGNGINVRSRWSGADLTIGENGGTTATQLGIRTYTGDTELADLNRGLGVPTTETHELLDTTKLDMLRIVARDGTQMDVDLSGATSLQDVVDAINGHVNNTPPTTVTASLSANGNGINLVDSSVTSTGSLRVEVIPGTDAAEYLGFVAPGATEQSSTLTDASGNYLMSAREVLGSDMLIVARDGTELWIDLAGTSTVQDVIDRINADPNAGPAGVTARLAAVGNGIELVDASVGAGTLRVQTVDGSEAARYLGFVADEETQSDPGDVQVVGTDQVLTSEDRHTLEADSVFNTLLRLRTALEQGDEGEISRAIERLDQDTDRVNFAVADIGSRLQNLDVVNIKLQDENVQLQSALSSEIDVDLVEAISNLTARQYAFEASLRTAASLLQISLLNFI